MRVCSKFFNCYIEVTKTLGIKIRSKSEVKSIRRNLNKFILKSLHSAKTLMYTEIFLLLVCLLSDLQERIELDNALVASRKRTWMGNINLSKSRQKIISSFSWFHGKRLLVNIFSKMEQQLVRKLSLNIVGLRRHFQC